MSSPSPVPIPTAVFDASPLVFLDLLGYTDLLPEFFRVVVAAEVAAELLRKPDAPGGGVPGRPWLDVRAPGAETLERTARGLGAGAGETASIALALELPATVVLDDLKARRYARTRGLEVVGTLGLLVLVHRSGQAVQAPEAEFARLEAHGMWLSPRVKAGVLGGLTENRRSPGGITGDGSR